MKKFASWLLIIANLVGISFTAYYAITLKDSLTSNIFGAFLIFLFLANCIFAMVIKRRTGFWYLLFFMLAMIVSLGTNYMVVLPAFYTSIGYIAIVSMLLLFAVAIALAFLEIRGTQEKVLKKQNAFSCFQYAIALLSVVALIVFTVISYDVLFNKGYSMFELYIGGLLFYLALIAFGFLAITIRHFIFQKEKGKKLSFSKFLCVALCILTGAFSLYGFSKPMLLSSVNAQQTRTQYINAFGDEFLTKSQENYRSVTFSIPAFFMGIKTAGYGNERNVCYFESTQGEDKGIKLSYDVYFPTTPQEKPSPVLIRMHGRGGDIGNGNYSMPNKYFASKGYVVYEIQYGDYLEKQDTPFQRNPNLRIKDLQKYMLEFVRYAKASNTHNADWKSVFLSGNSFGGMMGDAFALSFDNNPEYDALGITVKGLVPFYPSCNPYSTEPTENSTLLVNKNSPPAMFYMGTHDGYVDKNLPYALQYKYAEVGNPRCAVISPQYAGHGSDGYFAGYYMQTHLYFMERFMAQYR